MHKKFNIYVYEFTSPDLKLRLTRRHPVQSLKSTKN